MQTILIVDDQQDILKVISRRLQNSGFTTLMTERGMECIEMAVYHKPDAILLDIMMPDANGLDICKQLKSNPVTSSIPILLVSGKILPQDVSDGFSAGANDYIKKPFEHVELIERVKSAIKQAEDKSADDSFPSEPSSAMHIAIAAQKLKQPLTLINISSASIKRLLAKEPLDKIAISQKLDVINTAIEQITGMIEVYSKTKKTE